MTKLIVGNWKMHGTSRDLDEVKAIAADSAKLAGRVDVALCVPATLIHRATTAVPGFAIGSQDMHYNKMGPHTGDISAAMIKDAGGSLVIVGHSERRESHHEANEIIRAKAEAAIRDGLRVIICVGEDLKTRKSADAIDFVSDQLSQSLPGYQIELGQIEIAYEPIWAIGTGLTPTMYDIAKMHDAISDVLQTEYGSVGAAVRVLYGGSVKPENAEQILMIDEVGGALVGGASLKAADFLPIVEAGAA